MKKTLDYILAIASVVIAICVITFTLNNINNSDKKNSEPVVQVVYDINDPISEEKVRIYLKQLHVRYVDVAIAQMKLESASMTSKVFREGNNLFGMKLAEKRPTTALGVRNNHAYYSHWRQSCIDYALFQAYCMDLDNISSEETWIKFIGRIYAEDLSYHNKIVKMMKKDSDKI